MRVKDKTVLITGAARGIGQAIVIEFAKAGADVIGVDFSLADAQQTAAAVEKQGRTFKGFACDITDETAVSMMLKEAQQFKSGFDILVNNAGVLPSGPFTDRDFAVWRKTVETNLTALMALTHLVLPYLFKRKSAHIVNIASIAGKYGTEGLVAYSASKHGVVGFSSALRFELQDTHIGVSCIFPSQVETRLSEGVSNTFLTPVIQPREVAIAVRKAVEKNLAEVYVPKSQRFVVSILPSLAPGFVRWFAKWTNASKGWVHAKKEIPANMAKEPEA